MVAVAVDLIAALSLLGFRFGSYLMHSASPCGELTDISTELAELIGGRESPVLGIAHNAGASANEVERAVDRGGAVIDLDVVAVDGQLLTARETPAPAEARDAPRAGRAASRSKVFRRQSRSSRTPDSPFKAIHVSAKARAAELLNQPSGRWISPFARCPLTVIVPSAQGAATAEAS